jgi:hypothetical protein
MIWNVKKGRPWLGQELMQAQGFPKDMKLRYDPNDETLPVAIHNAITRLNRHMTVTDSDLKKMAGNTMTVPIMGLLQVRAAPLNNIQHPWAHTNTCSHTFQQYNNPTSHP